MKLRTLALALALSCGLTVIAEARQSVAVQRVNSKKSKKVKTHKVKKHKVKRVSHRA